MALSIFATLLGGFIFLSALFSFGRLVVGLLNSAFTVRVIRYLNRFCQLKNGRLKRELKMRNTARAEELDKAQARVEHYKYKDRIFLGYVTQDRTQIFGRGRDWKYNPHDLTFVPTSDGVRAFCFEMFAEMAGKRLWILKNERSFWTTEKELLWQKVCPKQVLDSVPTAFDQMKSSIEKQAIAEFESDDSPNRAS